MKVQKSILVYGVEFFPNEIKERHIIVFKKKAYKREEREESIHSLAMLSY